MGYVINPQLLQAQIDGGTLQGFGMAVMEGIRIGEDGRSDAVNFNDYKIPCAADIPPFTNVFVDGAPGPGPFGAKAVGELSVLVIAPALANAVEEAVGVRITDTPITAEKIYAALRARTNVASA